MAFDYAYKRIEYFDGKDISLNLDPLTGLFNRNIFSGYVNWLIEKGKPFSFFIADIDNFKNINDTFGHLVGDVVIARVAKYFLKLVGEKSVVGRYGGDEFMFVFEGITEYKDVWNLGSKIHYLKIGGLEDYGITNLNITVSVGIARYPSDDETYTGIINLADKALYRAKVKGRNCFIIYMPEKHADILLQGERDRRLNTMQLAQTVINNLTVCGENITAAISSCFKSFVSYYTFDHICIETRKKLNHSVVSALSGQKYFKHIPYEIIDGVVNSSGYLGIDTQSEVAGEGYIRLKEELLKQKIRSSFYCKIFAYDKEYGFIRVDTANSSRVWQNDEMSMIIIAARTIGLLLYYQHKTLEDLPIVLPVETGDND